MMRNIELSDMEAGIVHGILKTRKDEALSFLREIEELERRAADPDDKAASVLQARLPKMRERVPSQRARAEELDRLMRKFEGAS